MRWAAGIVPAECMIGPPGICRPYSSPATPPAGGALVEQTRAFRPDYIVCTKPVLFAPAAKTRSGDRQVLGNVATITAVIAAFLLLISVVQPAAERLHLPYTVLLAVVGVAVGGLSSFLLYTPL